MSVNKQVKHVIQNAPYYLWDNLIVDVVKHETRDYDFEIYRIEIVVKGKNSYLDLISDENQKFLGLGAYNQYDEHDFVVSKDICRSFAIQKYLEEAY